jgi:hypothetical protein
MLACASFAWLAADSGWFLSEILQGRPSLTGRPSETQQDPCVGHGSDNRLGKFLFQIIEATRGGVPARDGNRSPRDDGSWGSRAKDFVICAEAACIDRLPYCNRGAVGEASWLYCCSYRGPIAQRKGMGVFEVVECIGMNSTVGAIYTCPD